MPKIKRTLKVTVAEVVMIDYGLEKIIQESVLLPGTLTPKEALKKVEGAHDVRSVAHGKLHTEVDIDKYIKLCEKEGIVNVEYALEEK